MLLLSLWAQFNVNSTFKKYSTVYSSKGIRAADAARSILERNGLFNVGIERVSGNLTDHFDPRTNVIRLSESVYDSTSVAAIGVACHEAGHAMQYAEEYFPMKLRAAIIPLTNIGSQLSFPLVLIGLVFSFYPLAYAGIFLFGAVVLFQLVTLPVEYNASRRAMNALTESGTMSAEELGGSLSVLRAAAMTYLAALAVALANLLRLISIVGGGRRRD